MTSEASPERERERELCAEDIEEVLLEGDRTVTPGTARAALSYPTFRRVYIGSFLSNVGSWMQNALLAAYAFELTGSPTFVSILIFAQLGPLLLLSLIGGSLADALDRRMLICVVAVEQAIFALVLAYLTTFEDPSRVAITAAVFAIGVGQAIHAPTFTAIMPNLVRKEDLAGAVSLHSANMNASRVVGPAIGGVLYAKFGAPWIFVGNAASYGFIVWAMLTVQLARTAPAKGGPTGWRRVVSGFGVARRDPIVGRCLVTMATFSFFCLPFVAQMPVLALDNLGIPPRSVEFGLLYATFGLGALLGALSIGTFLAGQSLESIVRLGFAGFSVTLGAFALLRDAAPAYPVGLLVGFFYFSIVTSLSTVLQKRLDDDVRGRVMAIWIMAFGGTVPIGALVAGPIIEATSITAVVLAGAAVAAFLSYMADLRPAVEGEVQPFNRRAAARQDAPGLPPDSP